MNLIRHRRAWILIAAIAICAALVLMLVPNIHGGNPGHWVAILPILFIGVISPLTLLAPMTSIYLGRLPDPPALPSSFQRPPPFQLA
jgi:hypothetical protein